MTLSLALAYTSVAFLVVACIRLHWRQEKDYWDAYQRGWDRAAEFYKDTWPLYPSPYRAGIDADVFKRDLPSDLFPDLFPQQEAVRAWVDGTTKFGDPRKE